ncbi:MAG: 3'-5' exonuclease [bacterium]|nr:3'-5' exonuclease [bacterium]
MSQIVFFDLETSGISPWRDEITQIAAVAVEADGTEAARFGPMRVQFDVEKASPEALKINHYSEEKWKDAVAPSEMVQRFYDFLQDHSTVKQISKRGNPYWVAQLAGHNIARFDMQFLRSAFKRVDQFCPIRLIPLDTFFLAAWRFHGDEDAPADLKLETLAKHFSIEFEGEAHDAMADVLATIQLAEKLKGD